MNFKSNAAYKAWLAYGHASGEFAKTPGNQPVSIKGKSHGVEHAFGGEMYAAGGSFNNPGFAKLPKDVQAKIKARTFEAGGQLTEFNEGGRHEENPIGGIPQGFAPDGQPNLVEQGETKLNSDNYIYSDTLKVTKDIALDFSLPKNSVGKTFAQVSKEANRPKSRRENDTIEEVATKRDLDNLMQAQEEFKKRDLEKDMQMMMEKHPQEMQQMMAGAQGAPQGMPQGEAPQEEMPQEGMEGAPQEMAPEQQIPQSAEMGMPQGQPMDPNQMPPEMLAQMQGAQQGAPVMRMGGNIYMCGGKMYDFGGWMDDNSGALSQAGMGIASGAMTGATIGGAASGPFAWIGAPAGAIIGGAIGGVSGAIKGHKKDEQEQIAEEEANKTKILQRKATNELLATPDAANIVQTPNKAMMGQSYAAGGWMDDNSSALSGAGAGAMTGLESGIALGANFGPYGELIGGIGGLLGGAAIGGVKGHNEDQADAKKQQELYDKNRAERQQYNVMLNAPQMYQGYQNPLQNVGAFPTNPSGSMSFAKYGGYQFDNGGRTYSPNYSSYDKNSSFGSNYNVGAKPTGGPGGGALANRSDSLAVSNNARAVHDFYRSNGYERTKVGIGKQGPTYELSNLGSTPWKTLDQAKKNMQDRTEGKKTITPSPIGITRKETPIISSYGKDYKNINQYYKANPNNPNQFWQREVNSGVLNLNAPMTFYDKRIEPQTWSNYSHYSSGDSVTMPQYDPIAVAPIDTLKDEDLLYRLKHYGPSGFNQSTLDRLGYTTKGGTKTNTVKPQSTQEQPVAEPAVQAPAEDMTIGTLPLRPLENIPLNGPSPQEMAWIKQYHHPEKNMFGNPKRGERGYYEEMQVPADSKEAQTYFTQHYTSPESVNFFKNYPHLAPGATMQSDGTKRGHIPLADPSGIIQPYRQFDTAGAFPYGTQPATTVTDNSLDEPTSLGLTPPEGMKVNPLTGKTFATGGFLDSDFSLYGNPEAHSFATGGFEGDPVKGDLRTNDAGKSEIYTGTEWTSIDNYKEPRPLNIDLNAPKKSENLDDSNPNEIFETINGKLATDYLTPLSTNVDPQYIKEYQRKLHSADETLKDKNLDLTINQSLPEFLAGAAPAAYNLGQGIFGKVQQLRPQDYMVAANMKPYQYNINPQLREADQSFAQGQEALRNAGLGGGSYATNMQQLANSRNQAINGLYTEKQNADAASYNQAMTQNKAIEAENLQRRLGIEDFNRQSKAAKTGMLQAGMQQLAQISEGSQSKKMQLALMKAMAPDFAGTLAYNNIMDQYLNKIKNKKESKTTK
jgi:hypothetical protein